MIRQFTILIIISFLLLLGIDQKISAQLDPNTEALIDQESMIRYENPDLGISILYPLNWYVDEMGPGVGFFYFSSDNENVDLPPGLSVAFLPSSSNPIQQEVKNTLEDYSSSLIDFSLKSNESISLSDNPAYMITFTNFDPKIQMTVGTLQIFANQNDRLYGITYQAPLEDYRKYLPTIEEMINSFQFSDAGGRVE